MNIAEQFTLKLARPVTVETTRACVCIPDRDSAEVELTRVRRQYGPALVKHTIRKDRCKANPKAATWRLNYTIRETKIETLF